MLNNTLWSTFVPNLKALTWKNESRNAKIDQLDKWSIIFTFHEAESPLSSLFQCLGKEWPCQVWKWFVKNCECKSANGARPLYRKPVRSGDNSTQDSPIINDKTTKPKCGLTYSIAASTAEGFIRKKGFAWNILYIDGLAQDCSISSALAIEIRQSCAQPLNSNSNSNIVYLTSTSIQHVWQRTRDWRSYTSTVGRLKLRYRSTAITKATQQGMRSHTIWLNDVAGCGITCWKSCFLPLSKEYSDMSIRWSFE